MANKRTFETFLREVDAYLLMEVGVKHDEIDDHDYAGDYEDGKDPQESARQALEDAGYFQS
jgi:hypothetical protein